MEVSKGYPRAVCALCPRIIKVRKLERFITQRSIPVWVLALRIGCFDPGTGYISTDIVEIYPSYTLGRMFTIGC